MLSETNWRDSNINDLCNNLSVVKIYIENTKKNKQTNNPRHCLSPHLVYKSGQTSSRHLYPDRSLSRYTLILLGFCLFRFNISTLGHLWSSPYPLPMQVVFQCPYYCNIVITSAELTSNPSTTYSRNFIWWPQVLGN